MPEIRYVFSQAGGEGVLGTFVGIGQAAQRTTRARVQGASEEEKAAAKAGQAAAKEAAAVARAAAQKEKARSKTDNKAFAEAERLAGAIVKAADKEARGIERAEARKQAAQAATAKKQAANHQRMMLGSGLSRGLKTFDQGGLLGLGGGVSGLVSKVFGPIQDAVGGALRETMHAQGLANRLSINSRKAGEAAVDPTLLRKEFEAIAQRTPGQTGAGVAEGATEYARRTKGDLAGARLHAQTFATAASAGGIGVDEIARVGATLTKSFGITGLKEMQDGIAQVMASAKESGLGLEETAKGFDRLGASAKRAGLTGSSGVNDLAALTSIANKGVGQQGGARAVEMLLRQLTGTSAQKLKAQGVDVYKTDKSGQTRPMAEVFADMFAKVGPHDNMADKQVKLTKLLGPRGFAAASPLFDTYKETFNGTKGTTAEKEAAASAAVVAAFNKAAESGGTWANVQQDAAQAQSSASAKMAAAWERVVGAVGDSELPAMLTRLADAVATGSSGLGVLTNALDLAAGFLGMLADSRLAKMLGLSVSADDKRASAEKRSDLYGKQMAAMGRYEDLTPAQQSQWRQINTKKMVADNEVQADNVARPDAAYRREADARQAKVNEQLDLERRMKAGETSGFGPLRPNAILPGPWAPGEAPAAPGSPSGGPGGGPIDGKAVGADIGTAAAGAVVKVLSAYRPPGSIVAGQ